MEVDGDLDKMTWTQYYVQITRVTKQSGTQ